MQLSRPFQIALAAVAVLGAAWMLVLRPHPSSSGNSAPAPVAQPSAPGVNGLANAVAKAHGAVALSQQNAAALGAKSAAASNESVHGPAATGTGPASHGSAARSASAQPLHPASGPRPSAPAATHAAPTDRAAQVSGPLQQGKVVVILFWDPLAADDQAVMHQLTAVSHHNGKVVVLQATPSEVASFGAVTRGLQILETPTTVVINRRAQAATLTGLTDAASIDQAVTDAQRGAGAVQTPSLTTGSSRAAYVARANRLCHSRGVNSGASGSLQQVIDHFRQLIQVAAAQAAQLHSVPEPAADRATLARWFGTLNRSVGEIGGSVSAASGKRFTPARNLLFAAQADYDRASQGLADYGLTACFAPASRTS